MISITTTTTIITTTIITTTTITTTITIRRINAIRLSSVSRPMEIRRPTVRTVKVIIAFACVAVLHAVSRRLYFIRKEGVAFS